MFEFKQFISFFFSPLVIVFVLAFFGWLNAQSRRRQKRAKHFYMASFLWLFIISYQPVSSFLLLSLEERYARLENLPSNVDYIVALGGDSRGRSYEVLRLYQQNKKLKIITTGYHPLRNGQAVYTTMLLADSGVNPDLIITKPEPRDTKEELDAIKKIVGKKPFVLVTAAYHMPRAIALFKKVGLKPIAAPTKFSDRSIDFGKVLDINAIRDLNIALHEYIGMLWYFIKGDI